MKKALIFTAKFIVAPVATLAIGYVGGRIHQHGIDVGRAQEAARKNGASATTVAQAVEAKQAA